MGELLTITEKCVASDHIKFHNLFHCYYRWLFHNTAFLCFITDISVSIITITFLLILFNSLLLVILYW